MSIRAHQVPIGSLHVTVFRPEMRFGSAINVWCQKADGGVAHAHVVDGDFIFTDVEPGAHPDTPTMYVTDELLMLLGKAIADQPVQTRGQGTYDHLQDAMAVRDRLLALVEHQTKTTLLAPVQYFGDTTEGGSNG